jgi:hypothetical protein
MEIMSSATAQMNLKDVIVSDINQSQNGEYCMIPLKRHR